MCAWAAFILTGCEAETIPTAPVIEEPTPTPIPDACRVAYVRVCLPNPEDIEDYDFCRYDFTSWDRSR
jgi:hypothetical protein